MKIIKYLFLLLLLALFALSVFVATQKGNFDIERSRIIKSPKTSIFTYVNDYRNWENFASWKGKGPNLRFIYPVKTIGKNAHCSWSGTDGNGEIKTVSVMENEYIFQKMKYGGSVCDVFWTFKDTVGGTKVSWRTKGTMSFGFKIYTAFHGGTERIIGGMFEQSLQNLDKSVDFEISSFKTEIIGRVKKLETYYIQQRFTSRIENVPKNLRIMIPKIIHFFKKNKLAANGYPFVIYHRYDLQKGVTDISVCMPVSEEILISPESDMTSGKLEAFDALKLTLTGDYSHDMEAREKASVYLSSNRMQKGNDGMFLEIYRVNVDREKHPSKWITDIYIPIATKIAVAPKPKTVQPDAVSLAQPEP